MKITIIRTGYVGLVTGACFAETGSHVTCVDIDTRKIDNLNNGILPIYEPGLEKMVKENLKDGTLAFSSSLADVARDCQVFFIAVGTPPGEVVFGSDQDSLLEAGSAGPAGGLPPCAASQFAQL